jgi:beta-lactamase class A
MIASSEDLQSRARTWIRRELRVFSFLYPFSTASSNNATTTSGNAEFLLSYIVSIVKMVDVKASDGHAENLLTEFLGRENSRLFLHELNSWLRSPYAKVEEWDQNVQYDADFEEHGYALEALA